MVSFLHSCFNVHFWVLFLVEVVWFSFIIRLNWDCLSLPPSLHPLFLFLSPSFLSQGLSLQKGKALQCRNGDSKRKKQIHSILIHAALNPGHWHGESEFSSLNQLYLMQLYLLNTDLRGWWLITLLMKLSLLFYPNFNLSSYLIATAFKTLILRNCYLVNKKPTDKYKTCVTFLWARGWSKDN